MSKVDNKRLTILEAAITQFSQYGYRKTSMEDIANAAGVSRPSLYSYFENKEEIFRSLSSHLNDQAFEQAKIALTETRADTSLNQRIENALLAFNVSLFRLLDESPHGAELMDESSRLCGDIAQTYYSKFQDLLANEISYAVKVGELDLVASGITPASAAETIRFAVVGLKANAGSASNYQKRVQQFIRVYIAGLAH